MAVVYQGSGAFCWPGVCKRHSQQGRDAIQCAARLWFDSEQIQIEQRVNVGSQEQPVFGMVVLFALIRLDVGCLQHGENLATRDQTPITVAFSQIVTERLLAPSFADLPLNQCSLIAILRANSASCPGSFSSATSSDKITDRFSASAIATGESLVCWALRDAPFVDI